MHMYNTSKSTLQKVLDKQGTQRTKHTSSYSFCYHYCIYLLLKATMSRKLFTTSKSVTVSGVDEVVVGESDTKKSKKENKSLISSAKKEKKKSKEKETRYAHLGDESSGEDENDGK